MTVSVMSVCLSVCVSVYVSVCLSVHASVCLLKYMSVCPGYNFWAPSHRHTHFWDEYISWPSRSIHTSRSRSHIKIKVNSMLRSNQGPLLQVVYIWIKCVLANVCYNAWRNFRGGGGGTWCGVSRYLQQPSFPWQFSTGQGGYGF